MMSVRKKDREKTKNGTHWDKRKILAVFLPLLVITFVLRSVLFTKSTNPIDIEAARLRGNTVEDYIPNDVAQEEDIPPVIESKIKVPEDRLIMILIANYRDTKRCSETLKSLFENAVKPDLVRVSVYDQIAAKTLNETTCVEAYCDLVGEHNCRHFQIQSRQIEADKATGPVPGRHETEKLITNEQFCMAIDSHSVFVSNWDEKVIGQYVATDNPKAIITVYPKSTELIGTEFDRDYVYYMCRGRIAHTDPDAMVMYAAMEAVKKTDMKKPRLHSQIAGGFSFGPCQSWIDVPNDPYTPFLFHGEEYSRAARLFTHGYDMYAPPEDIVYHWYEHRKYMWDKDWTKKEILQRISKRRVRFELGLPYSVDDFPHTESEKYGIGTKRTMAQFIEFSGIDPLAPFVGMDIDQFQNCRDLEYVPYNE